MVGLFGLRWSSVGHIIILKDRTFNTGMLVDTTSHNDVRDAHVRVYAATTTIRFMTC